MNANNSATNTQTNAINNAVKAGQAVMPERAPSAPAPNAQEATFSAANALGANMGILQGVSGSINSFNQTEATRLAEQATPGLSALNARLMSEANAALDSQNKLPQDVINQISQFAAERGISRGTAGQFEDLSLVRDFGLNLTSWRQSQQQQAASLSGQAVANSPRVNPMSPLQLAISPSQLLESQTQYNAGIEASNQAYLNTVANTQNYNANLAMQAILQIAGLNAGNAQSRTV
jgi:hypothetical protein